MNVKMAFHRKRTSNQRQEQQLLMDKHENSILVEDMKHLPSTTLQLVNDIEFWVAVKVP